MRPLTLSACALALSALILPQMNTDADARPRYKKRGAGLVTTSNSTGGRRSRTISRGATGADTATTNSAAGGNASRPEQAVPNSSVGGGR